MTAVLCVVYISSTLEVGAVGMQANVGMRERVEDTSRILELDLWLAV